MKSLFTIQFLFYGVYFFANTYYVSPTGKNLNNGLSLGNAFRTLQHAANTVQAGDSVLVADSTYVGFDIRTSGNAANPIVFLATGSNVIINRRNAVTQDGINIENADWIEIRGFRVLSQQRAGIRVVLSDNVAIRYNTCLNNQRWGIFTGFTDNFLAEYNECAYSAIEHGIYVSNSSDNAIIRYNISHHNRAAGMHFNGDISQGGDGINHNPQVYNNVIYRNGLGGGSAINMDGNQNALIYNNLIYDNHATGIALFQIDGGGPSSGARIFHNTIIQDDTSRWALLIVDGAINAHVKNNILINQHSFRGAINISADSRTGFQSDYNIMTNRFTLTDGSSVIDSSGWRGLGYDTHSFFAPVLSQLFNNAGSGNFTLAPGSKAINFGTSAISPIISTDLNNQMRPLGSAADAGAYESNSTNLPLHWIKTIISLIGTNIIFINGILATVSAGTKVVLKKWNHIRRDYEEMDSKFIPVEQDLHSLSFKIENAHSGKHRYVLQAKAPDENMITSSVLNINIQRVPPLIIFPNPTAEKIFITPNDNDQIDNVSIYDITGKVIKSQNTVNTIEIKELIPGNYILALKYQNQIISSRLFTKK